MSVQWNTNPQEYEGFTDKPEPKKKWRPGPWLIAFIVIAIVLVVGIVSGRVHYTLRFNDHVVQNSLVGHMPPVQKKQRVKVELFRACYDDKGVLIVGYNLTTNGTATPDDGYAQSVSVLDVTGVNRYGLITKWNDVKSVSGGESYRRVNPADYASLGRPTAVKLTYDSVHKVRYEGDARIEYIDRAGTIATSDPRLIDTKGCTF